MAVFPNGVEIAYAAIPAIRALDEPLKGEVKAAFASSMSVIWKVMIGIAGLGLVSVALLEEVPMKKDTDRRFGLADSDQGAQRDLECVANAQAGDSEWKGF